MPFREEWVYDPRDVCLNYFDDQGRCVYEVMLEKVDSAAILDWIMQVYQKRWLSPKGFHEFVEAINYICDGIQKNICPGGLSGGSSKKKFDVAKSARERNLGWLVFPRPKEREKDGPTDMADIMAEFAAMEKEWFEVSKRRVDAAILEGEKIGIVDIFEVME